MTTPNTLSLIPSDVMADMQAVADAVAAGKPVAPEIARRVQERSRQVLEELLRLHGVREIAVDLVRAIRDEE
jgi:hypothetical protein